jgi:hypothetical protein
VSRRRKRRRSRAEPKLEAVGSSAWFGGGQSIVATPAPDDYEFGAMFSLQRV